MGALPPSKVVAFFAWAAEVRTMGMHDFCCPGGVVYVGAGDPRVNKSELVPCSGSSVCCSWADDIDLFP